MNPWISAIIGFVVGLAIPYILVLLAFMFGGE